MLWCSHYKANMYVEGEEKQKGQSVYRSLWWYSIATCTTTITRESYPWFEQGETLVYLSLATRADRLVCASWWDSNVLFHRQSQTLKYTAIGFFSNLHLFFTCVSKKNVSWKGVNFWTPAKACSSVENFSESVQIFCWQGNMCKERLWASQWSDSSYSFSCVFWIQVKVRELFGTKWHSSTESTCFWDSS